MSLPIVSEIVCALEPVTRDSFIDDLPAGTHPLECGQRHIQLVAKDLVGALARP